MTTTATPTLDADAIVRAADLDQNRTGRAIVNAAIRLGGLRGRLALGRTPTTATPADVDDWVRRGCPMRRVER